MNATEQDKVAHALGDALKGANMVAARTVYSGGKLDRSYEPGPHELLAILVGAGVQFYPCRGIVSDACQLALVPDDVA
jgi:hypothetical protein